MTPIEVATVRLLRTNPFFASVLMQLSRHADVSLPFFAAVRKAAGRVCLVYNPHRMAALSPDETIGVLEHECLHIVFRHLNRRGDRSRTMTLGKTVVGVFNVACDLAINPLIDKALPPGVVLPEHFRLPRGRTAEQYYEALLRILDQLPASLPALAPDYEGGLVDDHEGWEPSEGQEPDPEASEEFDESLKRIVEVATEAARARGSLPGFLEEAVDTWLKPPRIPWPRLLRRYVGTAAKAGHRRSWMRPNRRFGEDQKGRVPVRQLSLVLAVDTSGSIGTRELHMFAAVLRDIATCYRSRISVIECDVRVQKAYVLSGSLPDPRFLGRGGTRFEPVFSYVDEHRVPCDLLVYLTDLYGTFPARAPRYPVLWACTPGHAPAPPPFGRILELEVMAT